MDNMPILYKNVMPSLPSDFARDVFLWASDKFTNDRHAYRAEAFAREADRLARSVKTLIDLRQRVTPRDSKLFLDDAQATDLLRFILARHANWRMGGNVKTAMPDFYD